MHFAFTSTWETSVPIEEPILPFMTLPPPVMVPVKDTTPLENYLNQLYSKIIIIIFF